MLSAVSLAGMILLGLLSGANNDLLKELDGGVCSDLLIIATFNKCVIGAEEVTALFLQDAGRHGPDAGIERFQLSPFCVFNRLYRYCATRHRAILATQ